MMLWYVNRESSAYSRAAHSDWFIGNVNLHSARMRYNYIILRMMENITAIVQSSHQIDVNTIKYTRLYTSGCINEGNNLIRINVCEQSSIQVLVAS